MDKPQKPSANAALRVLRLTPSTPLQALGSKARRAAALAEATRKGPAADKGAGKPAGKAATRRRKQKTPLELTLEHLLENMRRTLGRDLAIATEGPGRWSTSLLTVNCYRRNAEAAPEAKGTGKPAKAEVSYVFYPSVQNPGRLGSVAVYCDDAERLAASVRADGLFFGLRVRNVAIEMGQRPFVDILFRP